MGPAVMPVTICLVVHLPRPVTLSGERLGGMKTLRPRDAKTDIGPTEEAAHIRLARQASWRMAIAGVTLLTDMHYPK